MQLKYYSELEEEFDSGVKEIIDETDNFRLEKHKNEWLFSYLYLKDILSNSSFDFTPKEIFDNLTLNNPVLFRKNIQFIVYDNDDEVKTLFIGIKIENEDVEKPINEIFVLLSNLLSNNFKKLDADKLINQDGSNIWEHFFNFKNDIYKSSLDEMNNDINFYIIIKFFTIDDNLSKDKSNIIEGQINEIFKKEKELFLSALNYEYSLELNKEYLTYNDFDNILNKNYSPIEDKLVNKYNFTLQKNQIMKISENDDEKDLYIMKIFANDLHNLLKKEGALNLFFYNVRNFVPKKNIDDSIRNTIIKDTKNFGFLSNGIVIVAQGIDLLEDRVTLHNFSIINGCQTTTLIGNSTNYESQDFFVIAKIIIIVNNEFTDFYEKIANASNSQKAIKANNLASLTTEFINIEKIFENTEYKFIRKKGGEKLLKSSNTKINQDKIIKYDVFCKLIIIVLYQLPYLIRQGVWEKIFEKKEKINEYFGFDFIYKSDYISKDNFSNFFIKIWKMYIHIEKIKKDLTKQINKCRKNNWKEDLKSCQERKKFISNWWMYIIAWYSINQIDKSIFRNYEKSIINNFNDFFIKNSLNLLDDKIDTNHPIFSIITCLNKNDDLQNNFEIFLKNTLDALFNKNFLYNDYNIKDIFNDEVLNRSSDYYKDKKFYYDKCFKKYVLGIKD